MAYTRTSAWVIRVSSVTCPSPLWYGAMGRAVRQAPPFQGRTDAVDPAAVPFDDLLGVALSDGAAQRVADWAVRRGLR